MPRSYRPVARKGKCEVVALQKLGVVADVTVKPGVEVGKVEVTCSTPRVLSGKELARRTRPLDDKCTVRVFQEICVRIPILFETEAVARMRGVVCGPVTAAEDCTSGHSGSSSDCLESGSPCSESAGDCLESDSECLVSDSDCLGSSTECSGSEGDSI